MPRRILMIDDDRELCEEVRDILVDEGFEFDAVHTGTEGLRRIGDGYDLVLLDLKIPGCSGFEILSATKTMAARPKIAVLTGRPLSHQLPDELRPAHDKDEEILGLADAVLNKPFDIDVFLSKVAELTKTSR
jgi:CheY-like chemotaxis protein